MNALANGGYCLANYPMIEGTGLEELVHRADTPEEWKSAIRQLAEQQNDAAYFAQRTETLRAIFDCRRNAERIVALCGEGKL